MRVSLFSGHFHPKNTTRLKLASVSSNQREAALLYYQAHDQTIMGKPRGDFGRSSPHLVHFHKLGNRRRSAARQALGEQPALRDVARPGRRRQAAAVFAQLALGGLHGAGGTAVFRGSRYRGAEHPQRIGGHMLGLVVLRLAGLWPGRVRFLDDSDRSSGHPAEDVSQPSSRISLLLAKLELCWQLLRLFHLLQDQLFAAGASPRRILRSDIRSQLGATSEARRSRSETALSSPLHRQERSATLPWLASQLFCLRIKRSPGPLCRRRPSIARLFSSNLPACAHSELSTAKRASMRITI